MSSLPYMQLYVSDYLADTAHLNATQHGAYMLLLMNYWQRGKPLDNSNDRLAFVARLTAEEWQENKEVLSEFFQIDGETWLHTRIEIDLEKVREKSAKASFAGRSSGVQRALNHKDKDKDINKDITSFDAFWNIYPRKVGKQDAQKSYERALRLATPEEILQGATRFASDPNRVPTFTPHPATWLNQGRWSDEPLPSRTPEVAPRGVITTPTIVPPAFDREEALERQERAIPMPESVRDLFKQASDL